LRTAIKAVQGHSYIDLTKLENCMFRYNYSCLDLSPTTGLYMDSCMFYDNFTIGAVSRVEAEACSFNNSSFSSNTSGIEFDRWLFVKPWLEGYNRFFQIRNGGYLRLDTGRLSETYSSSGSTKFYIVPTAGATTFTAELI